MSKYAVTLDSGLGLGERFNQKAQDELTAFIQAAEIIDPRAEWIARHPGRPVPAARVTYFDKPDTAFASLPTVMDTGQGGVTYEDNGTNHPFIADGGFQLPRGSGSGQAFQYTHVDAGAGNQLTRIAYTVKVDPTAATTDTWALGLAMANGPLLGSGGTTYRIGVHLSVSATGWGLSKVSNATGTLVFTDLASGFFAIPLTEDDMTEYTTEAWRVGNTSVVILPDGTRIEVTDTDIGAWSTRYGYVELVMVARDTDPTPKFTEAWYDVNGVALPGHGGLVYRDDLDNNINPEISVIRGTLGNPVLRIADSASAVNYITVADRVTGSAPYFQAEGADPNIGPALIAKGAARWNDGVHPFMTSESVDTVKHKDLTDGTNTFPTLNQPTTGNAATATALHDPRLIDGVSFDGSHDIGTGIWTPANSGLIAWSMDPMSCYIAGGVLSAGFLYLQAVIIPKAGNITNLIIDIATAGASLTSGQNHAFLYQGGTRLGVTADQTTAWQTLGAKVMAIAGGPVAAAAGLAYVGVVPNGTTPPALLAPIAAANAATIPITNMNAYRSGYDSHTGLTTTGPATLGTLTDTTPFWAAVS